MHDLSPDMAWHHDGALDVRRIGRQIRDQRLGEALHRKFGCAICAVRAAGTNRCPEAVHAARIHNVRFACFHHQRQEGANAVVHATPADVERLFPLDAVAIDNAAAAANSRIVD